MQYDTFQVAVKAIVLDSKGKILFLKDFKGEWDLPGGRINKGESLIDALVRECEEELGLKCQVIDKNPFKVWTGQHLNGDWRVDICFKVSFESNNFKKTEENQEYGFFSVKEAKNLNLSSHLNNLKEFYD
jgi:8-oxo-dGTP diphosphatase